MAMPGENFELQSTVVPGPSLPPTPGDEVRGFVGIDEIQEELRAQPGEFDAPPSGHAWRARMYLAAIYGSMALCGWNDGSSGPLIPKIQASYHVGFVLVSLIFVLATVGFISGAFINMHFAERMGLGRMVVIGSCFPIAAYAIQAPAPPFPLFVMSFILSGMGYSILVAQANVYVVSLRNSEVYMGMLHASYGLGALTSPLVATQFAQMPRHWSFHYLCSFALAILNVINMYLVFRFRTQDELLTLIGENVGEKNTTSDRSNFRQILSIRAVHLLSIFAMLYVGVEVTMGGWITTYLIDVRGGGPSAGYISSGFFGGMMVGRLSLIWLNKKIGENRAIYLYAGLAIGLEFVVWFVPSFVGGGVAVSCIGVVLGPIYPIIMNRVGRIIPRWLHSGSIGWVAGFGQAGSAVLPFISGAIASKSGIRALQPFIISMMSVLPVVWFFTPISRKID
ncbi:MFS general substrate transporter [Roridomyces roridus]|uniref:MFS general substrate transporter n=1 Tax=Roridomyces roridus TaxID=1738132 RepID=A0AAD7FP04_9AGAR|nr:MFS general substrate transporter [Roridomyces roridus]